MYLIFIFTQIESAVCSGTKTLVDPSGGIDDGYPLRYPNNLYCGWIIDPPGDDPITIEITYLRTGVGDYVKVYDGGDNTASLIGEFSGYSTSLIRTSTNGIMFVEFTTDGTNQKPGFTAQYWVRMYKKYS